MIWVAPTAVIAGDVSMGDESSLWHHAVLRGDEAAIVVGKQSNIQDNCVVHVDLDAPTHIGDRVTVGHGAIVHGCTLEDEVTVGMGAIVTTGVRVGKQSFIAAGAVLPEGMVVPRQSLALGVPAKVKPVTPALLERIDIGWQTYLTLARAQLPTWPTLKGDPAHQVRREPRR